MGEAAMIRRSSHLDARVFAPDQDVLLGAARGLWYGACAFIPASAVRIAGIAVCDILFLLSAVCALLARAKYRSVSRGSSWTAGAFLVFVATALAQPAPELQSASAGMAVRIVLVWTVWRWTCAAVLGRECHLERSIRSFLIGGAISGAVGIAQMVTGAAFFGASIAESSIRGSRAPGLAVHVNEQGCALAVGICMGLALWCDRGGRGAKQGRLLLFMALSAAGLVLSGSITGMLALFGGAAYLAILGGRLNRVFQIGAVLSVGLYAAASFKGTFGGISPLEHFRTATGSNGGANTLRARLETMEWAWDRIAINPFRGVGLDVVSGGTSGGETLTHNIFLLYWYQGGIVLFLALVIVLVSAATVMLGAVNVQPALRNAISAGFVAAVAFGLTAPIMFQRSFWFPAVLAFSMIAVHDRVVPRIFASSQETPRCARQAPRDRGISCSISPTMLPAEHPARPCQLVETSEIASDATWLRQAVGAMDDV
ncbi:MAG: O-antigen ligase family protein [Sporichthyaceae bacterium]